MLSKKLQESLLSCSKLIEENIDNLLPQNFSDSNLVEAMRYSSLSGGKRIRPFLTIICAEIFGNTKESSINAATAIEFIHTYSLIHDDLPAMDDDDFRREKPSCHKKFDEATAILAGDALLTYAFEILSQEKTHKDANIRCELVKILAKASGFHAMVGGQMIDLENSEKKLSEEKILNLHYKKTGELFIAACEMGAIIGDASKQDRDNLRNYAKNIGLAFQIKDDILDHHEKNEKESTSIVDLIGLEKSVQKLNFLTNQAKKHIENFDKNSDILSDLADFINIEK